MPHDSEEVQGVVEGLEVLQQRFATLMAEGREDYLLLYAGKTGDKATEVVLEHFRDRERRHTFYRYFREVEELHEILSPDPFLRPYLDDYAALTRMYQVVRAAYEPHVTVEKSFLRKTAQLVQTYTETSQIHPPEKIHTLNEETFERLTQEQKPDTVKVFNLLKTLHTMVGEQGNQAPYLIPIGERAEQIAKAFEERQTTTQETLRQLEALLREYRTAEQQQQATDLSPEGFAVYWLLNRQQIPAAHTIARAAEDAFTRFPHWQHSAEHEREVRKVLYKTLVDANVEHVVEVAGRIMTMLRRAAE
jgi:type I restriction enzyme R subunit